MMSSIRWMSVACPMAFLLLLPVCATVLTAQDDAKKAGAEAKGEAKAQSKDAEVTPKEKAAPPPLGKAATEAVALRYAKTEHWVQKAVSLLSLNHYWHPAGSAMILSAVKDKDKRLRAFALETLLRAEEGLLPTAVTAELLGQLIDKQLDEKTKLFRKRLLAALKRIVPDSAASDKKGWEKWWRANKDTWQPKPWTAKEFKAGSGTVVGVADRAFDLYRAGLDVTLCMDSTGSMQATINTVAAALGEMVDILKGISPNFRLGLVHYKDTGDMGGNGAKVILPLTKGVAKARKKLLKLRAFGGGDLPESVLAGLALALGRQMRWKDEANKVVIVIGDAPPHQGEVEKAIEIAKQANEDPGSQDNKAPTTGKKKLMSPYITSAIGIFVDVHPSHTGKRVEEFKAAQKRMRRNFAAIAKAGGGVFVDLTFKSGPKNAKPAKPKKKPKQKGPRRGAPPATRRIVEHILVLSFGERFAAQMKAFTKIYFDYQASGLIK